MNADVYQPIINRSDTAHEEATRDPIFLFQSARVVITEPRLIGYCDFCERLFNTNYDHVCDEENQLTLADLVENEWGEKVWLTESVWLTRAEADRYGRAKNHRYPEGWRVYCVNAEGQLAQYLKLADEVEVIKYGNH